MFPLLPQILHYTLQQKIVYLGQSVQYVTSQTVTYCTNVLKRFLCPIWYVLPGTLSPYLIRRHQIFQSSAFSNSLVFCIPISAIDAAVRFGLNSGASTSSSFFFLVVDITI